MHQNSNHSDPRIDTDNRPTRFGSPNVDRKELVMHSKHVEHINYKERSPYKNLLWMGLLHIPIMYGVMFAMVDTWGDIYQNLNTFYMAVMMAAHWQNLKSHSTLV